MVDVKPGSHIPPALLKWALGPEGHAQFGWGKGGDFEACVAFYTEKTDMSQPMIKGMCSTLHKLATGEHPGPNAHQKG